MIYMFKNNIEHKMNISSPRENTISQVNPDQGQILLSHQKFSESTHVPQNYFLGSSPSTSLLGKLYHFFWGEQKSDVSLDMEKNIIFTSRRINFPQFCYTINLFIVCNFMRFDTIKMIYKILFLMDIPQKESLFIGGFVPMTKCEYAIEIKKPLENGFVIIQTPSAKIIIDRKNNDEYYVESFFRITSKKFESKRMIVPTKDGKISVRIFFDGITKTNTISSNSQNPIITPFCSLSSSQLKYPSFTHGYIKISTIVLPDQDPSTVLLYSISQSAPRKLITPIGEKNMQPFGFDGPHDYTTIKNGLIYMKKFGYRGTIWFDIEYLKDENYIKFLKSLIHDESFEAGIHFSKSLTRLSPSEACNLISDEYTNISIQLNTPPKTWCSFRNGDNVDFANYIFDKYQMIWRNGEAGINAEPIVGNLEDDTWDWWNLASKAGIIYPVFAHQTDREPATKYSISFSKFRTWVDNYHAKGISIIPFQEWWLINANTFDTIITNISVQKQTLTFKVKTNGEKGLVNVNIASDHVLTITDTNTEEKIMWSNHGDNSITFYVQSNHEYEIFMNEIDVSR